MCAPVTRCPHHRLPWVGETDLGSASTRFVRELLSERMRDILADPSRVIFE